MPLRPGTGAARRSDGVGQETCDAVSRNLQEIDPFEWGFKMACQIGNG